jgi:hypothetical protein
VRYELDVCLGEEFEERRKANKDKVGVRVISIKE